jgi:hypothetical protein
MVGPMDSPSFKVGIITVKLMAILGFMEVWF